MTSVYFDPAVGGDGSTVTDDSNPSTGLGNGGHRARFVPSLNQLVAVANWVLGRTNTITASVDAAAQSEMAADAAAGRAGSQARRARLSADAAAVSAASAASSAATINLPATAGNPLTMLRVKSDASGYELRTVAQLRSDLGIEDAEFLANFLAG